ncbi:mandelate racemase/muconate lactonizing enzyme family protein [Streptomyces sp. Inha503]|uniref:mandelate racemase/muconate lactonizing enzyme family protein n=1 Tax=Streptomyces sp. Inha503 TaxID=3383314 RepID=UPI00399F8B1E
MGLSERITSAEVYRILNPSLRPTVVRLRTDAGTVGLGDTGVSYGAGTEAMPPLLAELLRTAVLGRPLSARHEILLELTYGTFWAKRAGSLFAGAVSAIDQALHDAAARALGVPLHELLGGRVHTRLPVYANGWYFGQHSEEDRLTAARRVVADGHRALKTYPLVRQDEEQRLRHPSPARWDSALLRSAIDHVRRLRERVGDDVRLMVDLGGCVPRDHAPELLGALRDLGVEFAEEPFDPADESSLHWLPTPAPVPVATGERLTGLAAFDRVLRTGAVSIIQPDVCLAGGHGVFQSVAALARGHSIRVSPHNCSSGIGTAHTVQAAAAVPNLHSVETFPYLSAVPGYREILTDPLEPRIEAGLLTVPDRPGIGVDLDDTVASAFLVKRLKERHI